MSTTFTWTLKLKVGRHSDGEKTKQNTSKKKEAWSKSGRFEEVPTDRMRTVGEQGGEPEMTESSEVRTASMTAQAIAADSRTTNGLLLILVLCMSGLMPEQLSTLCGL